jgi:hypothetical protein
MLGSDSDFFPLKKVTKKTPCLALFYQGSAFTLFIRSAKGKAEFEVQ